MATTDGHQPMATNRWPPTMATNSMQVIRPTNETRGQQNPLETKSLQAKEVLPIHPCAYGMCVCVNIRIRAVGDTWDGQRLDERGKRREIGKLCLGN